LDGALLLKLPRGDGHRIALNAKHGAKKLLGERHWPAIAAIMSQMKPASEATPDIMSNIARSRL